MQSVNGNGAAAQLFVSVYCTQWCRQ